MLPDLALVCRRAAALGILVLSAGCHVTPAASPAAASALPLKKLRLYETGVGYFERSGNISSSSDSLPVPASHVDDALKTLIVLSDGKARVTGIEFDSVLSGGLSRSLAALPSDAETPVTYRDVLESLRGIEVEVTAGDETWIGQLAEVTGAPPISLAPPAAPSPAAGAAGESSAAGKAAPAERGPVASDTQEDLYLTLIQRGGAVRRLRASRVDQVRPVDPAVADRLGAAVGALSGRAAQLRRSLRVLTQSAAPVRLGYIAETPVWRSTYRLLLDGGRARLQGWALLHNDTDEPWAGVSVELVNGRPDSFLFPLSAPRYARRELAHPDESLSTVPQLADKTPDQLWGDNAGESMSITGMGFGSGEGRLGGGHVTRVTKMRDETVTVGGSTEESDALSIGNLAEVAQAAGVENGALFTYRLAGGLHLRAHGSALVPFTQQDVEAQRLTWFEGDEERGRSGARLANTTAQTLPSGPVAVYEASGFAGETGLPRLKPRERAFLLFGLDLDVELRTTSERPEEVTQRIGFDSGYLTEHFVRKHRRRYAVKNRGGQERRVYVALDIVKNASVQGFDAVDFDKASGRPLGVLRVAPRSKLEREVTIDEALLHALDVRSLSARALREKSDVAALSAAERATLGAAAKLLDEVEKADRETATERSTIDRIEKDLGRLRDHLEALGDKSGSPAGANPLVVRILALEDERSGAQRRVEQLEAQREARFAAVKGELERLR
ncbi:hypothetical protein WME99_18955 [Sorangium sp. So ce136]|uniref:hypothetical protein n=1 Tax=Sorangium sp. So ce136 TaxID=3133284 RepID=UPI003F03398F